MSKPQAVELTWRCIETALFTAALVVAVYLLYLEVLKSWLEQTS